MTTAEAIGRTGAPRGSRLDMRPGRRLRPPFVLRISLAPAVRVSRRTRDALGAAVGFLCHSLSSARFVCGLDPQRFYEDYFAWRGAYRLLAPGLSAEIDEGTAETRVALFAMAERTARSFEGFGTVQRFAQGWPDLSSMPREVPRAAGSLSVPAHGRSAPVTDDSAVMEAISGGRPGECCLPGTKAALVVRSGRVVGEFYGEGYGPQTPIVGYSVAKSLANTIIGRMVALGLVDIGEADLCEEWRKPGDPRRAITLDHLLAMTSGLRIDETHSGFDPVSRMLFSSPDMGAFAAEARLGAEPGTRFRYTSANTMLLSRIIRDRVGGSAAAVRDFLESELFAPLGMVRMLVECDASGTPILSTFAYGTARDWARLGQLYLEDGCADGNRLLPDHWVRYSLTPGIEATYGAGFRINSAGSRDRRWHVPELPPDTFFAHGHLGQFVIVVPSRDLVIVRLGAGRRKFHGLMLRMARRIVDACGG